MVLKIIVSLRSVWMKKKKKKKQKKRIKTWKVVLTVLAAFAAAAAVIVFLFQARTFKVEGSSYYSDNSITSWIQNDRFASNSLYILLKYNYTDAEMPQGVEEMKISLSNPWTVKVRVTETKLAGYVNCGDSYLFFDGDGTAVLKSGKLIEGVPYIEGLEYDPEKTELGRSLPVTDDSIFEKIVEVTDCLDKFDLNPDRISCAGDEIRLYFGTVEVMLGTGNYEMKLEQAQPILQKLNELYPGISGVLHLENYEEDTGSIRFVPSE